MTRARWAFGVGLALFAGLGLWLVPESEPARSAEPEGAVEAAHASAVPQLAPPPPLAGASLLASPGPRALNVVGPGPDDPHEPGMVPHPLDERRARLDTENRLMQALNDAMSFRKVREMRELLVTYRRLDPQDVDKSQRGYGVIADCIESPGEASLAAARQFYGAERHSPLRRFVRRICFENTN